MVDTPPNKLATTRVSIFAKQWIAHESYVNDGTKILNDIGLVQLPQFIYYNKNILPIVPNFFAPHSSIWNTLYVGKTFTVMGWGLTADGATTFPTDLQYTTVQVVSATECATTYSFATSTSNIVCVKSISTTTASNICAGDDGKYPQYSLNVVDCYPFKTRLTNPNWSLGPIEKKG